MERINIARILLLLLLVTLGVAGNKEPMALLENIAGKLVFKQTEGNSTYVRETELASSIPTETMFELFDPQKNFSSAKFTYTWDLGNGEVIQGNEPVVKYRYPVPGNYTLRLQVKIDATKAPPITGDYSRDVKVLDAIKHIEMVPADYDMSENTTLSFHVDGSPPMWVCWRLRPHCGPDKTGGCTLTMLYENTLTLDHTFTSPGFHCLDISVHNEISKYETSFSLYVRKNSNPHMFFILSCAAILVATFSFITVIACHPRHYSRIQPEDSANAIFLKGQSADGQSAILFNFSTESREEKAPLLLQHGTQYTSL